MVDHEGNPVEKTKFEYPYSYDPYVIMGVPGSKYEGADYSDRLMQFDWDKFHDLSEKHFGDRGQLFHNREMNKIESFLQEYHDKPNLKLVMVSEGANVSNGYPYWIFFYNNGGQ